MPSEDLLQRYRQSIEEELFQKVLPFWDRHSVDLELGGFFRLFGWRRGHLWQAEIYVVEWAPNLHVCNNSGNLYLWWTVLIEQLQTEQRQTFERCRSGSKLHVRAWGSWRGWKGIFFVGKKWATVPYRTQNFFGLLLVSWGGLCRCCSEERWWNRQIDKTHWKVRLAVETNCDLEPGSVSAWKGNLCRCSHHKSHECPHDHFECAARIANKGRTFNRIGRCWHWFDHGGGVVHFWNFEAREDRAKTSAWSCPCWRFLVPRLWWTTHEPRTCHWSRVVCPSICQSQRQGWSSSSGRADDYLVVWGGLGQGTWWFVLFSWCRRPFSRVFGMGH